MIHLGPFHRFIRQKPLDTAIPTTYNPGSTFGTSETENMADVRVGGLAFMTVLMLAIGAVLYGIIKAMFPKLGDLVTGMMPPAVVLTNVA